MALWTPERIKRAIEMYSVGNVHLQTIADALGSSTTRVSLQLRKAGVKLRGRCEGASNPAWKGGRKIDKDGYVLIYSPTHPHASKAGCVREHRLVIEKHLGRILDQKEVVHHKNGVKEDNRIENLELFENNGAHLARSLKGKCPKWTKPGMENIMSGIKRSAKVRTSVDSKSGLYRVKPKRELSIRQTEVLAYFKSRDGWSKCPNCVAMMLVISLRKRGFVIQREIAKRTTLFHDRYEWKAVE